MRLAVCVLGALALFCWAELGVTAVQMLLDGSTTRCVGEDLPENTMMRLRYKSDPPSDNSLHVIVTDTSGTSLWTKTGSKGGYGVTSVRSGEHRACFTNMGPSQLQVEFTLDSGEEAKDYEEVAKKENLKPVEAELRRLEDTVKHIRSELTYARTREEQMRNTNEGTNARVLWFSIFSMIILVGLGAWQVFYLKKFFTAKKMI